jgi:hypothetical protein
MNWNEIVAAIVTSLIASVVFWLVFNVIPSAVERRKIKPLLDFDLYQIYSRLAFFLEVPLRHSMHSPSFLQHRLYNGELKKEDFGLYLATKCLTKEYQKVDDKAKNLMPIGRDLKERTNEILEMIQKLYVFNKYLTAEQILLCRKIADKITTYDFEMQAFERVGNHVMGPVDPTMRYMAGMFNDTYRLFLQLQDMLINQKPAGNELGDFYKNLFFRKVGLLFSKGQFRKVAKLTKGASDINTRAFYFRSLYRKGDTDKGLMALREYLRTENERLIYIRGHFEEFTDDAVIRDVLIEVRSEEEYQEMINCLTQEKEQQKAFEEFAREMRTFYDRKTAKIVNKK